MLTPFDDYPIHQTPLPLAHPASGDPNHYDRFWFNGYTEDYYFACGMAVYPNRGIIDGAFSVVHNGVQRSVFASGRSGASGSCSRRDFVLGVVLHTCCCEVGAMCVGP